jgi:hypothetical protein
MEIGLLPLLYYMLTDSIELIGKAARMQYLVSILRKCRTSIPLEIVNQETYKIMRTEGWNPFWSGGMTSAIEDDAQEQKLIDDEIATLTNTMNKFAQQDDKTNKRAIQQTAERLENDVLFVRYQGYREFLYFVINFIAFYGYLLGILAYYFPEDSEHHPFAVRAMKFGMTSQEADWHGNFAGDLMWTIEPLIILGSPMLLEWMKPKAAKVKTD